MSNGLCLHSQDILLVPVTAVKPINMFPPQHPENLLAFAKTHTMENGDVTLVQQDGQLDSQNERERELKCLINSAFSSMRRDEMKMSFVLSLVGPQYP